MTELQISPELLKEAYRFNDKEAFNRARAEAKQRHETKQGPEANYDLSPKALSKWMKDNGISMGADGLKEVSKHIKSVKAEEKSYKEELAQIKKVEDVYRYINSDINSMIKFREQHVANLEKELAITQALLKNCKDATEQKRLEAKFDAETFDYAESKSRLATLRVARREAHDENVSVWAKGAEQANRLKEKQQATEKIDTEYRARVKAAEEDPGALEAAKKWRDTKKEQLDQEYGSDGILGASGADALGILGATLPLLGSGLLGSLMGSKGNGIMDVAGTLAEGFLGKMAPFVTEPLKLITNTLSAINKKISEGVDLSANLATQYLGKIDARLQGTPEELTYYTIKDWMNNNFAANPLVNQEVLLKNIADLVEKGIAYNLEERALISTIKDKMIDSFDVLDRSLTRIIRLQQADLTMAQLGAEAELDKMLNSVFQDTSYLYEQYDNVASTILDATSQFSYKDAVEYNYAVQKWLGSLYSVGISDSAISNIAQGLNLLTTGNVTEFTNNSAFTTLFGLAASNAGMSMSDILTEGLNATGVNKLMQSMVAYLQKVAENTGNQVVKSAWSNITNLSVSDLRAITNLTSNDVNTISSYGMTYESAQKNFYSQLDMVGERTHLSEVIENVLDNAFLTIGDQITSKPTEYLMYRAASYLSDSGGGGFFSGLGDIFKGVTGALGFLQAADDIFSSLKDDLFKEGPQISKNAFDGWLEVTGRSSDYEGLTGAGTGTSYSGGLYVSASGVTAQGSELSGSTESISSNTIINGNSSDTAVTVSDLYNKLFKEKAAVRVQVAGLEDAVKLELADAIMHTELIKKLNTITDTSDGILVKVDDFGKEATSDLSSIASIIKAVR